MVVAPADTFFCVAPKNNKNTVEDARMELLAAMVKFLQPLQVTMTTHPKAASEWISLADAQVREDGEGTVHDDGTGKPAVAETKSHVAVLRIDENTGTQLSVQVEIPIAASDETNASAVAVPWRHWDEQNRTMGAMDADKASTVSVFNQYHSRARRCDETAC